MNLRFLADWRDSPARLDDLPVVTPVGTTVPLGELAAVRISDG